jgi:hypothetical protein
MANRQLSEKEIALLLDIIRLLKKHGPEAFESLATYLSTSDWSDDASAILQAVAAIQPHQSVTEESKRSRSISERITAQLRNVDPARRALLEPVVGRLARGEALPRLKDVAEFALTAGLPIPNAKSRGDAVISLLRTLKAMPVDELEKIVPDLQGQASKGTRSLKGWNRIIERSRAETTGPKEH